MHKPFRLFKAPSDKPDYYCYCWSDVNGKTVHTYVPKTTFSRAIAAHNLGLTSQDFPSHTRRGLSPLVRLEIRNPAGVLRTCLSTEYLLASNATPTGWTILSSTPVPLNEVI